MMNDLYENINDYNLSSRRKILIVFDDMMADIMTNKEFKAIIKELFIRYKKLNVSLVLITQSYFSVPKDVRLNSTHYLITKISNKRELQNIAINHSADIDYNNFMNIYRECTKESFNFLTIETMLPAGNPLRLVWIFIKMTVTEHIKTIDKKDKAKQAQYDLDRLTAKISALSSGELRKYKYLTGENLGYRPSVLEQTKFDYSLLGKVFDKGLDDKDDKKKDFWRD